jgi:3-phenylpropionate/cinnamic acid dioxygenase small subunit
LFEQGTWYLTPDTPLSGTEDVARFLHDNVILYDGVPGTRHVVTNIRIDLADDHSTARAQSYVIVFQAVPGSAPEIIFQGAYDDAFAHSGSSWHFAERRILTDGTGDMSRHLKGAQPVPRRPPMTTTT